MLEPAVWSNIHKCCIISEYVVLEALIFWHNSNLQVWPSSSLFLTALEEKLQLCRYLFLFVIGSLIVCLTRCLWNFRTAELIKGKKDFKKNHNCNLTIWQLVIYELNLTYITFLLLERQTLSWISSFHILNLTNYFFTKISCRDCLYFEFEMATKNSLFCLLYQCT